MSIEPDGAGTVTVASRLSGYLRGGGIFIPIVTAAFAFIVGGVVVLAAGGNPIDTYRAIFEGSGLNWVFPWLSGDDRTFVFNLVDKINAKAAELPARQDTEEGA